MLEKKHETDFLVDDQRKRGTEHSPSQKRNSVESTGYKIRTTVVYEISREGYVIFPQTLKGSVYG